MDLMFLFGIVLVIFSGGLSASTRFIIKQMPNAHKFTIIGFGYLFALPWYALWLVYEGIPVIDPSFWKIIAFHIPLMIVANIMIVNAHRIAPMTLLASFLALTPAFHLFTGYVMGVPTPRTLMGYIGVVVIVVGLYTINTRNGKFGLLEPFKQIYKNRGAFLMFLVALVFSVTANLDPKAMNASNIPFYLIVDHGLIALIALGLRWYYVNRKGEPDEAIVPWRPLATFGLCTAFEVAAHMCAFLFVPVVSYVISGKRLGTILFAFAYGLYLGFSLRHREKNPGEREYLVPRFAGMLIAITGMLIIIFQDHA